MSAGTVETVMSATALAVLDPGPYRAAFRPSADLAQPHVGVSADVVVAEDEATARELASGYGLWVRSIRTAEGGDPVSDDGRGTQTHLDGR